MKTNKPVINDLYILVLMNCDRTEIRIYGRVNLIEFSLVSIPLFKLFD